ncbi:MAG: SRPBCC family protein [Gemmatimonadales bacterium]
MDGARVTQSRSTFSLRCRVEIHVKATPDEVWDLLVEAPEYHRWNSTVTRIDGQIREGERLTSMCPAPIDPLGRGCPTSSLTSE